MKMNDLPVFLQNHKIGCRQSPCNCGLSEALSAYKYMEATLMKIYSLCQDTPVHDTGEANQQGEAIRLDQTLEKINDLCEDVSATLDDYR